MPEETPEPYRSVFVPQSPLASSSPSHHGISNDIFEPPSLSHSEEHGSNHETGSEWSFSTPSTPSDDAASLNPLDAFLSERALFDDRFDLDPFIQGSLHQHTGRINDLGLVGRLKSPIQQCPHEVLLHMLSCLPATDLLTIKLVSRRFYDLVNSPHVWISAFSKHFPASATLKAARAVHEDRQVIPTERRSFARLSPVASWASEYLLRTKLLRCLARGRPSLPFAAPSQSKPNKGYATFSFYSRLRIVSHLEAKFGPPHDKRSPQFIHGSNSRGTVSISDRRGELAGWGLTESLNPFRTFEETNPGTAMWGSGRGEVVGVTNPMDLSCPHGMVCAEGFPGGHAFFLASNDKHPRLLAPLQGVANHEIGVPRLLQSSSSFCSAWIAKSPSVPRHTQGIVGMLFGSSSGVLSAYSLGAPGGRGLRLDRGELTARWMLCPGVPIIGIQVHESISAARTNQERIWAVVLNALGEVFCLKHLPKQPPRISDKALAPELALELRSWQTGQSASWALVRPTARTHRPSFFDDHEHPSYFSHSVWHGHFSQAESGAEMRSLESWLSNTPADIKSRFNGWDMRQRLEVDFSSDDGNGAGEAIFVFRCGYDDVSDASEQNVAVLRYARCAGSYDAVESDIASSVDANRENHQTSEWRCSQLLSGRSNISKITATAIDNSLYAQTTIQDDFALWRVRLGQMGAGGKSLSPNSDAPSMPKVPGQRARFIGAGTATGQIYLWNARDTFPATPNVTNYVWPLRVIQTSSPEISSLALSSLYLVHGGSEGLVQAWDPLSSTAQPIRTICSALSRRALLAAQQDRSHPYRNASSVGAICLDPDPGLLRGIVALRGNLRYWSYSSTSINKDTSRSQKRRIHGAARGIRSGTSDGYTGGRRVDLKDFVSQEMAARRVDEQQKRAEEKQNKRINGRFGLDLLGSDASEEELIAFAQLLSEEEQEKQAKKAAEKTLNRDASEAEVQAHVNGLSLDDYQKWKYASWEDRFQIPSSEPSTTTRNTPTSTPNPGLRAGVDDDLRRAMQLSLEETRGPPPASNVQSSSGQQQKDEEALAEAIRRSLGQSAASDAQSSPTAPQDEDADVAEAIRLSMQQLGTSPASSLSPSGGRSQSVSVTEDDEFPALGSSPLSSPPSSAWGKGKWRA